MSKSIPTTLDLHRALEALLFLVGRPLRMRKIAELLGTDRATARSAVEAFRTTWNARGGGTIIAIVDDEVELLTHPDCAVIAEAYVRDEVHGELTRPQLEALTVIAYRGPMTKAELEQIRGVHCGLILRNLLLRGLVAQRHDAARGEHVFTITMDFLRHLDVTDVRELPDYERLRADVTIDAYLAMSTGIHPAGVPVNPPPPPSL